MNEFKINNNTVNNYGMDVYLFFICPCSSLSIYTHAFVYVISTEQYVHVYFFWWEQPVSCKQWQLYFFLHFFFFFCLFMNTVLQRELYLSERHFHSLVLTHATEVKHEVKPLVYIILYYTIRAGNGNSFLKAQTDWLDFIPCQE